MESMLAKHIAAAGGQPSRKATGDLHGCKVVGTQVFALVGKLLQRNGVYRNAARQPLSAAEILMRIPCFPCFHPRWTRCFLRIMAPRRAHAVLRSLWLSWAYTKHENIRSEAGVPIQPGSCSNCSRLAICSPYVSAYGKQHVVNPARQ